MKTKSNIEELLICGKLLAEELGMKPPTSKVLRSKIEEILFERENYSNYHQNLITQDELVELLVGHLYTLIYQVNKISYIKSKPVSTALIIKFRSALLD